MSTLYRGALMFQEFLRFGLTLIYSLMWLFFSKIVSTSKGKLSSHCGNNEQRKKLPEGIVKLPSLKVLETD